MSLKNLLTLSGVLVFVALGVLLTPIAQAEETTPVVLKVMSYNIQIGATTQNPGWDVKKFNLDAIAEVIREQDPDIVALQEVDRLRSRSGKADQVVYLAEKLGMYWAYSPSYFDIETREGRGMYGNAILSKYPIVSSYAHTLWRRGQLMPGEYDWVIEKRSILETKIDVNGRLINVFSTHLSTTADQRQIQTAEIKTLLTQMKGPKILMGDFNAKPQDPEMKNLSRYVDVLEQSPIKGSQRATWPNGTASTEAIDYILVSKEWELKEAKVVIEETGASDHNPIVAIISLP